MNERDHFVKLKQAIISCDDDEIIKLTQEALEKKLDANEISKEITESLTIVGKKFEKNELFLPELMIVGNGVMSAMALINDDLSARNMNGIPAQGKVIIGTVEGDIHNIGKDIVAALLTAAGFEVHNLGINVSALHFLSAAETLKAQLVGISALLTTTIGEQKKIIELFKEKGKRNKYKIIVGGAPVTQLWADQIGADGYAENAGKAVELAKKIVAKSASNS